MDKMYGRGGRKVCNVVGCRWVGTKREMNTHGRDVHGMKESSSSDEQSESSDEQSEYDEESESEESGSEEDSEDGSGKN